MPPKSMTQGKRNVIRPNDSASLWNASLSPGWSRHECDILRKAVLKFGMGNWKEVVDSGWLPGKTNAQCNLQLQRLLGQQSTAEFTGIHLDPAVVGAINSQKIVSKRKSKNGFIVHQGPQVSRQELKLKIQENRVKFEVPEEVWRNVEIPLPEALPEALPRVSFDDGKHILVNDVTVLDEKRALLAQYEVQLAQTRQLLKQYSTQCDPVSLDNETPSPSGSSLTC